MEKSSETFGMVGGWFIDGSTARLLSFSRMVVYVLRLCLCVLVVCSTLSSCFTSFFFFFFLGGLIMMSMFCGMRCIRCCSRLRRIVWLRRLVLRWSIMQRAQ